ncbi:hypothetical protein RKD18_000600 [Streptomyces phaeoluteigriseus]
MDSDLRRTAVDALVAFGRSRDWRGRADAGHSLAGFAGMQEAFEPLPEPLLDPYDTSAFASAEVAV